MSQATASSSKPLHRLVVKPLGQQLKITTTIGGRKRTLVDTSDALQLAESNYPVRFYFPRDALLWAFTLKPSDRKETYCPYKGFAQYHDLAEAGTRIEDLNAAIWSYSSPFTTSDALDIRGLFCLAAPNTQFDVQIDGQPVTEEQARKMNDEILTASPSNTASPSLPREVLEEERRSRSSTRNLGSTLQAPAMNRSASNGSAAPPNSFPIARPLGAELEIDSTNPMLADMIYRYDDEAQEEQHHHQHNQQDASATGDNVGTAGGTEGNAALDDHLAWFQGPALVPQAVREVASSICSPHLSGRWHVHGSQTRAAQHVCLRDGAWRQLCWWW